MPDKPRENYEPPPREQLATPQEVYPFEEHRWTVQQLHHIGTDVGKLQEAVDTLKESVRDQGRSITDVKQTIHIATGVVIGAGAILGVLLSIIIWLVDKGFDQLAEVLAK